jgi:hypothetical protein
MSTDEPLGLMNQVRQALPSFPTTSPSHAQQWKRVRTILAVIVLTSSVPIAAAAESEGRHQDLEVKQQQLTHQRSLPVSFEETHDSST